MASGTQTQSGLTFKNYSVNNGKFKQYGKNAPADALCNFIEGDLDRVQFFEDEGNEANNIEPYKGLKLSLRDGNVVEVLKVKLFSQAGLSIAKRLHHVKKGDLVRVTITNGTKNKKASFISLRCTDENGELVLPEPAEWATGTTEGMSKPDKDAFNAKRFQAAEKAVEEHSAFYVPETVTEEESAFWKSAKAFGIDDHRDAKDAPAILELLGAFTPDSKPSAWSEVTAETFGKASALLNKYAKDPSKATVPWAGLRKVKPTKVEDEFDPFADPE